MFNKGQTPWNKGLTVETSESIKKNVEKSKATQQQQPRKIPWNKGLTKNDHPTLKQTSENMKQKIKTGVFIPHGRGGPKRTRSK